MKSKYWVASTLIGFASFAISSAANAYTLTVDINPSGPAIGTVSIGSFTSFTQPGIYQLPTPITTPLSTTFNFFNDTPFALSQLAIIGIDPALQITGLTFNGVFSSSSIAPGANSGTFDGLVFPGTYYSGTTVFSIAPPTTTNFTLRFTLIPVPENGFGLITFGLLGITMFFMRKQPQKQKDLVVNKTSLLF